MIERNSNDKALERIFEEVYNLINDAKRIPLTEKIMLDESDLAGVMDDLREAIPKEVKTATQILEEQKNIINKAYADADIIVQQAKKEAEAIVTLAKNEADRMIQQEEVVKQANAVAEELKSNALRYQEEVKTEADEYALQVKRDSLRYVDDMLQYIGGNLNSALEDIRSNRNNINEESQKLLNHNNIEEAEAEVQE